MLVARLPSPTIASRESQCPLAGSFAVDPAEVPQHLERARSGLAHIICPCRSDGPDRLRSSICLSKTRSEEQLVRRRTCPAKIPRLEDRVLGTVGLTCNTSCNLQEWYASGFDRSWSHVLIFTALGSAHQGWVLAWFLIEALVSRFISQCVFSPSPMPFSIHELLLCLCLVCSTVSSSACWTIWLSARRRGGRFRNAASHEMTGRISCFRILTSSSLAFCLCVHAQAAFNSAAPVFESPHMCVCVVLAHRDLVDFACCVMLDGELIFAPGQQLDGRGKLDDRRVETLCGHEFERLEGALQDRDQYCCSSQRAALVRGQARSRPLPERCEAGSVLRCGRGWPVTALPWSDHRVRLTDNTGAR